MHTREVIKKVKRIELITRRLVNPQLAGQYNSVFKGRGMDFDEVLPYAAGDDVRFIDWNVSARTASLHVKRFVEERELTVQIIVDASSSMRFGTVAETKRAVAAQVACVLAMLAVAHNDRVGLTIFDNQVVSYISPKKGRKHVLRLITEILDHRPRHSQTQLADALSYVTRVTKRRAIIIIISDFLTEGYERELKIMARRHDIVPVIVTDTRERSLDDRSSTHVPWFTRARRWLLDGGLFEFDDLESGIRSFHDPSSLRQSLDFRDRVNQQDDVRDRIFKRLKLDTMEFRTDFEEATDYVSPLADFFRRRGRRVR